MTPSASRFWGWLFEFLFFDRFAVYSFMDVDGIESEYIFSFEFLFFFRVSLLIGMRFEVIFYDTGKGSISDGCGNLFSALNAGVFLAVDEFSEATTTEPVVAWLHGNRNRHDFVAERAGDLVFDRLCKLARSFIC